jgi:2-amino-4-hydroxy-6-hydroxymethyldihydropteridine diphosphokinase
MTLVYIGIGSNLGDREGNIRRAMEMLDARPGVRVLRVSSLYETEPMDIDEPDPPMFLNAAAEVETEFSARDLLAVLKGIEKCLGRKPLERAEAATGKPGYRSREIDLDILVYGDEVIGAGGLDVPHPRLAERRFVLDPLSELCPERVVPGTGRTVRSLLESLGRKER